MIGLPTQRDPSCEPLRRVATAGDEVGLARSMAHCRHVTRTRAKNFYYGLKLMPEPKRSALYCVYAFMRACDDLADDAAVSFGSQAALDQIEQFRRQMREAICGAPGAPLPEGRIWPAMRFVTTTYSIDVEHLDAMLDGQRCDLEKHRYDTFDDLYDYCYKVASVVGLVCISLWGNDGQRRTGQMAEYRGIALQLTNILRDLVEDARRDRLYLPADDLARFDLEPEMFLRQIMAGDVDERIDRLLAFQIERTRDFYAKSAGLDSHISVDCRPASWAIMRIYRGLLDKIEICPRRVLIGRVRLGRLEKAWIAMSAARLRGGMGSARGERWGARGK